MKQNENKDRLIWKKNTIESEEQTNKKGKNNSKKTTNNVKKQKTKKNTLKEKQILTDNGNLDPLFLAIQGWAIVTLVSFILIIISLTSNLWVLWMFLFVLWLIYWIKRYKKINNSEKRIAIVFLTIISFLLVGIAPLILLGQKKVINLQKGIILSINEKNNKLNKNMNNTFSQMTKLNENYKKEIIQLKKEKLNYGETVKNKTINMIINNLKYLKKQNISNIDISKRDITKQEMEQKMIEEKKQNWSYNLEN